MPWPWSLGERLQVLIRDAFWGARALVGVRHVNDQILSFPVRGRLQFQGHVLLCGFLSLLLYLISTNSTWLGPAFCVLIRIVN